MLTIFLKRIVAKVELVPLRCRPGKIGRARKNPFPVLNLVIY